MGAEDLPVDDRRRRQAVEAVREGPPQAHAEPPLALVVEAVDPVDGGALVVPPEEEEAPGYLTL